MSPEEVYGALKGEIDDINHGYVEVETNASETYATILNRLFAAADATKITPNSKVWMSMYGGVTFYMRMPGQYTTYYVDSATALMDTVVVGSSSKYYRWMCTNGVPSSVSDLSNNASYTGTIRLYY